MDLYLDFDVSTGLCSAVHVHSFNSSFPRFPCWPAGVLVRALDLQLSGRKFDSQPFHFQVATLRKLFTSVTKEHNLVPIRGQ